VSNKRPERRSALVAQELARLSVDIAALSEVRFADSGSLTELGSGYSIYWHGKAATEKRLNGVAFMIKNTIASKLHSLPVGISDRLMSLRIPLAGDEFLTLVSAYAPTLLAEPTEKEKFYSDLRDLIHKTPASDRLCILGDFNARVGRDYTTWEGVLGRHGVGNCNDNGRLLLELCMENQLTITNTVFQMKNRHKTTWMHPRSRHWHLIDYIIVRHRNLNDVHKTRVMPSAECGTDHRLVRCKLALRFKQKRCHRLSCPKKKLNVSKLSSTDTKTLLQGSIQATLEANPPTTDSPDDLWAHLKGGILKASEEVLGFTRNKNRDWFDESDSEVQDLLTAKRQAHQSFLANPSCPSKKAAFRLSCSRLQQSLRQIKNEWWTKLAHDTQACADRGDQKAFYEALKRVYGPSHQVQCPLRSLDGMTLLTDKESILSRWTQHFQVLFEANQKVQENAIQAIPQSPLLTNLDSPLALEEVAKAVKQLKSGKAAGGDAIPPELWINGGPLVVSKLHELFTACWTAGTIPQELKDAVIVTLFKKGDKSDCSNYRGITLLSIAGKVLARVLLNRLVPAVAERHLPESQCGFRANRGTTDMVFTLRQIQEKCREQHKDLFISFIDLTKAFDTVSRDGLWAILERLGCPPKFLQMLMQLHDNQHGRVRLNQDLSESFPINNGVKQGCVLAPTLFTIFFSMMLQHASKDLQENDGVLIRYRMDGNVFNLRRLQARTRTQLQLVRELLFADDAALVTHTEESLQRITSCFSKAAEVFGLQVSLQKTEVLHQPCPLTNPPQPEISIRGTALNVVDHFKYLGCTIAKDSRIDKEIDNRLAKANSSFGRLKERVWTNHDLKTSTKIAVYRAVVLTTLLYGCESWVLYRCHIKVLERLHQRCLRSILRIHWSDHVTNTAILEKAGLPSIEALVTKTQLRWAGHVSRMNNDRLPKQVFFGELASGHRTVGAPKKRFKDTLKKTLKNYGIPTESWTELASDRSSWRSITHQASATFEAQRRTSLEDKRQLRKRRQAARAAAPEPDPSSLPCSRCGRLCASRIGLISHERSCFRRS